jgi:hypothetical protein
MPATLHATTLRNSLIDYRAELFRLRSLYPDNFKNHQTIEDIDKALLELEGNVTTATISANTCNPLR